MNNIAVVTDSTAYLTDQQVEDTNIHVVPLSMTLDGETYVESRDITSEDYFEKVRKSSNFPKSSQPATGEIINLFDKLSEEYDEIISIHISSGISGTVGSVKAVAQDYEKAKIHVVDSKITCGPLNILVTEASKMAENGSTSTEILSKIDRLIDNMQTYFIVDDLELIIRSGRVSKLSGSLANMLNIKPFLAFENGSMVVKDKIRTKKKAIKMLKELFRETEKNSDYPLLVTVNHVFDEKMGLKLKEEMEEDFPNVRFQLNEVGPVVGTHIGVGSFGIAWMIDPSVI